MTMNYPQSDAGSKPEGPVPNPYETGRTAEPPPAPRHERDFYERYYYRFFFYTTIIVPLGFIALVILALAFWYFTPANPH
jgi:hypothetical protein